MPQGRSGVRRRPVPPPKSGSRGRAGLWRLASVSVLTVLTLLVVVQTTQESPPPTQAATPTGTGQADQGGVTSGDGSIGYATGDPVTTPLPAADPPDTNAHVAASITVAALPAGADFASAGSGTWHVVPGSSPTAGAGPRALTYTVEVEDGVPAEQDQDFARIVDATLADPRSWIGGGEVSFTRIDAGDPDIRISLTSQLTIRAPDNCGWDIPLEASCFNRWMGRVLINDARWVRGALSYRGDVDAYRAYAVNHEVGHALGNRHQPCPVNGGPAPIMMQQSWSTSDDDLAMLDPSTIPLDGYVCAPNPYPFPEATAVPASTQSPSPAG